MMYYRRKLLLATLQIFERKLSNTSLQKILFLITRKQPEHSYEFIPYKYGCFSFQANQDLHTMIKYGLLDTSKSDTSEWWALKSADNYFNQLSPGDRYAINAVKRETAGMNNYDLIRYTYVNFPYYAVNSEIKEKVLNKEEIDHVNSYRPELNEYIFFTIGYEGTSLEHYINKLIFYDIRLLCDIRKNPVSMKYGFSRSQLKNACESVGIKYKHIPELGIDADKRKSLNSLGDYQRLFKNYESTTLTDNSDRIEELKDLTNKHKRIAITCFEKDVSMCHRGIVAKAIRQTNKWSIPIKHI